MSADGAADGAADGKADAEVRLRRIMAGVPEVAGYSGPVERMGGLTNEVWRAGRHVVRLPGRGTEDYIDRANEAASARAAAAAGVGPEVIHADAATGVMVTRFVEGAVTMTPEGFAARTGAPGRAGQAFRRLHVSGAQFPARFELFAMIDDYRRVLSTKDVDLPAGYDAAVAEAETLRGLLARTAPAPVACHCDPLCENFLDTGARMWIVDWEYSGMNDPMWDLGDLSVEGRFSAAQEEEMLGAYFGGEAPAADRARMVVYKAMCDLLWTLWGLIQLANANQADDFRAYADGRFARCRALMGSPEFRAQAAVLAAAG